MRKHFGRRNYLYGTQKNQKGNTKLQPKCDNIIAPRDDRIIGEQKKLA